MELSVVIPVYRSARTLPALAERLLAVLDDMELEHELIFVEDGGGDESWDVLRQLQQRHGDRIVAVQLMRNFGQHNALMCGFRHCRGRYVVTLDDDLQNPPEEIPKLLKALCSRDLDLVYGVSDARQQRGWRNLGSWVVNRFARLVFDSSVVVGPFRVIRRELLDSIFSYNLNFTFVDGLLAWNTQRIGQVAVEHHPRGSGRSGYSLAKLTVLALNLFTNFSLLPLQLVTALGLLLAACGFAAGGFFLVQYLLANISVPGYASVIIAVLLLGGTQLLALGIIGEYLGRLHLNVNRKPQYSERQVLHATTAPAAKALAHQEDLP